MQQLDIFADSEPVRRTNVLIEALARFDPAAAQTALQELSVVDPRNEDLSGFQLLCNFVKGWPSDPEAQTWPRTLPDVSALEELLRKHITPVTGLLGERSRAFLRKCWRDLAQAAEACGITPEHRNCYAAELYLRAEAFPDVLRTARNIPGADGRVAVQRWLSLAHCRSGEREAARNAALRYAWLAAQDFSDLLVELRDSSLDKDWRDFQSDLGDLDATWFPAWCASEHKCDASLLENLPEIDGARAYRLVVGLAIRERGGLSAAVFEDRARLKRLNEDFFAFYLLQRGPSGIVSR